jgi:hypothetical protein
MGISREFAKSIQQILDDVPPPKGYAALREKLMATRPARTASPITLSRENTLGIDDIVDKAGDDT